MRHLFEMYEDSAFGMAFENSDWTFPTIEAIHLLALAILLGGVIIMSLRLMGLVLRYQSVEQCMKTFWGYTVAAMMTILGSGVLLFFTSALKYYDSPSFRVKMIFLVLALGFQFFIFKPMVFSGKAEAGLWTQRLLGIILLVLWFGVGLGGRAIGFLG